MTGVTFPTFAHSVANPITHNTNALQRTREKIPKMTNQVLTQTKLKPSNPNYQNQASQAQTSKTTTPVNWRCLQYWLRGYDREKTEYLISGFKHGFRIGFLGKRTEQDSPNLPSALANKDIVSQKIQSELRAGRIAGPFSAKPFPNFKTSPLGLVPKSTPGEFRLIHHLSWPRTDGSSVNDGIPPEFSHVQYAGIQDAINKIKTLGRGCFLAKTDVQHAFRIAPIHFSDYELLGFSWEGQFYYDKCLAFGVSSSCQFFEQISSALEWIAIEKIGCKAMVHILDDFLFIENTYSDCLQSLRSFLHMCSDIGILIADEKTHMPFTSMTFVGFSLDTLRMEASLPLDKLSKAKDLLLKFLNKDSCRLRELQSLIGFLNFCCLVITCGRAFLRRLIDLTIGVPKPYYHIRLNNAVKADMNLWLTFCDKFNGKSMFLNETFLTSDTLKLFTDSAKSLGFGAVYGSYWLYGSFPAEWKTFNITFLELYPIVLAVHIWAPRWKNHSILFYTDNLALVSIINNQTSKNPHIMKLLRVLILACLQNNILFQGRHIRGCKNVLADCLSRLEVDRFRQLSPGSSPHPEQIPHHLLPGNFLRI